MNAGWDAGLLRLESLAYQGGGDHCDHQQRSQQWQQGEIAIQRDRRSVADDKSDRQRRRDHLAVHRQLLSVAEGHVDAIGHAHHEHRGTEAAHLGQPRAGHQAQLEQEQREYALEWIDEYRGDGLGAGVARHGADGGSDDASRAVVTDWSREFAPMMEANRPGWIARCTDRNFGHRSYCRSRHGRLGTPE